MSILFLSREPPEFASPADYVLTWFSLPLSASTEFICKAIKTDKFDYVNLHHHFCGSYTASGDGTGGIGNLECLRLMKERDMGGAYRSVRILLS